MDTRLDTPPSINRRHPYSGLALNSLPQTVAKIPLKDVPEENLIGLDMPDSIDRIIIGPSKFPAGIFDAFLQLLMDIGADQSEAARKIIVSDLPLRQ